MKDFFLSNNSKLSSTLTMLSSFEPIASFRWPSEVVFVYVVMKHEQVWSESECELLHIESSAN